MPPVSRRVAAVGAPNCRSYLRILAGEAPRRTEMHQLVGELTIGETYFFRQREHFDLMRERILPDLLDRNQSTKRLRIWSAGCATGPEPYSIALLLHQDFQAHTQGWDVSILGTDINIEFLTRAREARFGEWALRDTSAETRAACFIQSGRDWVLRPEYRKGVTFEYHNLASEVKPAADGEPFDLILCRNVIIYFSPERMRDVIDNFYRSLKIGGWLIVGHAEPNLEMFHSFETISDLNATAYLKTSEIAGRPHRLRLTGKRLKINSRRERRRSRSGQLRNSCCRKHLYPRLKTPGCSPIPATGKRQPKSPAN